MYFFSYPEDSNFKLSTPEKFISKEDLLALFQSFVFFSIAGKRGFAYCSGLSISNDSYPIITLYSVHLEKKFRDIPIHNFDFIYSKSFDEVSSFFEKDI